MKTLATSPSPTLREQVDPAPPVIGPQPSSPCSSAPIHHDDELASTAHTSAA
jgi:hypothetical protein